MRAFAPTEFRGVAELGLIAGVGMLIAFACTVTFLPAAISLFRPQSEGAEIGFRWDSLHLGANLGGKTLQARDLWKHEDVPISGDSFTASVPKHGVVLLRVAAGQFRFR